MAKDNSSLPKHLSSSDWLLPDIVTFNALLLAAAINGQRGVMFQLFDRMVAAGMQPDTASYNHLITAHTMWGKWQDALQVVVTADTV
jgi:pentatricopeptide repeat protein